MPTPVLLGFPCGSAGKGCACNGGDLGLIIFIGQSRVSRLKDDTQIRIIQGGLFAKGIVTLPGMRGQERATSDMAGASMEPTAAEWSPPPDA